MLHELDSLREYIRRRIGIHRGQAEELSRSLDREMSKGIVLRDYRVMLIMAREQSKHLATIAELESLVSWEG